ncbi:MAG: type II toxin-antitoxin system HicA family toxin [Nitrospirae bacterium]|nr:type II toxin-antitoxin system HicA family toxin [Nitrospirota bacterium]
MPKLPVVSSKQVIRVLEISGFHNAPKRGKGSHIAFVKTESGRTRLVIVPDRNEIPKGTLLAILEQAGLTKDEFISLIKV